MCMCVSTFPLYTLVQTLRHIVKKKKKDRKEKVISGTEKIGHQSREAPWLARACLSPDLGLRKSGLAKSTFLPTPTAAFPFPVSADRVKEGPGG